MTQEQKDLLLKDLCARLPYGVRIAYRCNHIHELRATLKNGLVLIADIITNEYITSSIENIIPYLFPLSSMTEEQKEEHQDLINNHYNFDANGNVFTLQDFYCKYHFDYRGLIEKGLTIDATGLNIY